SVKFCRTRQLSLTKRRNSLKRNPTVESGAPEVIVCDTVEAVPKLASSTPVITAGFDSVGGCGGGDGEGGRDGDGVVTGRGLKTMAPLTFLSASPSLIKAPA